MQSSPVAKRWRLASAFQDGPAGPSWSGRRWNRCGAFRRLRRTIAIVDIIPGMAVRKHVLVVDDDGDGRRVIADPLLDLGFRVSLAMDGDAMRAFLEFSELVDVIILNASMPGEGSEMLAMHVKDRGIKLVMISGDPERMQRAEACADQLLRKPFPVGDLQRAVMAALDSDVFGQRRTDPT